MPAHRRDTYARAQVALHWLIVLLLMVQFLTSGGMVRAYENVQSGDGTYTGATIIHGIIGTSILLAMLGRLGMRLSLGAPPPPETEPKAIKAFSRGTHYAFYVLLIAMPPVGLTAVFFGAGWAAEVHSLAARLLLALVIFHILGALWHATKNDGVIGRIVPSLKAGKG